MRPIIYASLLLAASASAAEYTVEVSDFAFTPSELVIAPGDTVTWESVSGVHNVRADDDSFYSGAPAVAPWTFSHTFTEAGEYGYYCEPHGAAGGIGMAGLVRVQADAPMRIDESVTGTWFNPAHAGQGFGLEYVPATGQLVAMWFTYDESGGGQHWLVGDGLVDEGTVTMDVIQIEDGVFLQPFDEVREVWGSLSFEFSDCANGTVRYASADGQLVGEFPIQRLTPSPLCAEVGS